MVRLGEPQRDVSKGLRLLNCGMSPGIYEIFYENERMKRAFA